MTERHPRGHVPGREYLAIVRGARREPARPYTFDVAGLTNAEYEELIARSARFASIAGTPPTLRLTHDWPTP
jgi:hypothetical protein